jgi:uncharacterized protein YndB with AHSA1/START domain
MPRTRRTRTLDVAPDTVWRIVGDPEHQPRWWPKVARVEGVAADGFTRVYTTKQGRPVRADFRIVEVEAPRRRRWAQVVDGTPFERVLTASEEVATVEPAGDGCSVTIEVRQKLRGLSKFGGFMVKRATRKQLDDALDTLERVA